MRVEGRKVRFLRRVFDEPPINEYPDDEDGRRNEEHRPRRVQGFAVDEHICGEQGLE